MADNRTVAAEVLRVGKVFRTSLSGEPRSALCGMGICMECRMTIDGVQHQRTCQLPAAPPAVRPAVRPATAASFDILVVGAGPAGMAAAWAAAQSGKRVGVVDDNPGAGGQIWRGCMPEPWSGRFADPGRIEFLSGTRIYAEERAGALRADALGQSEPVLLNYEKLILATGARERFLPFPGWTLPGVFGAGGLQALVKSGMPVAGKRIVIAGTGPLLLAVAAYLRQQGGRVLCVAEQITRARRNQFVKSLFREPAKLLQAAALRLRLGGVRYRMSTWPVRAEGDGRVQRVVFNNRRSLDADYLACGFGLVPNIELAALLGCRIDDGFVAVNHWQETTQPDIYCAGEPTGIGGVELSLAEGQIAGYSATGNREKARAFFGQRNRGNLFRRRLDHAFALRPELSAITTEDTIVCRREDVRLGQILDHRSWRDLKLQTRCGMGACQGRVCGPAVQFLRGWVADSVRPPLYPVDVRKLL